MPEIISEKQELPPLKPHQWTRLRLQELMDEYNETTGNTYNHTDFCEFFGMGRATMSRYVNNYTQSYNREILTRIRAFFNVSWDEMFEDGE